MTEIPPVPGNWRPEIREIKLCVPWGKPITVDIPDWTNWDRTFIWIEEKNKSLKGV
jgi:hypothetical protein